MSDEFKELVESVVIQMINVARYPNYKVLCTYMHKGYLRVCMIPAESENPAMYFNISDNMTLPELDALTERSRAFALAASSVINQMTDPFPKKKKDEYKAYWVYIPTFENYKLTTLAFVFK